MDTREEASAALVAKRLQGLPDALIEMHTTEQLEAMALAPRAEWLRARSIMLSALRRAQRAVRRAV